MSVINTSSVKSLEYFHDIPDRYRSNDQNDKAAILSVGYKTKYLRT